jgi:hypothetical protein
MRTFHIGGTASRRAEQSTLECRNEGQVRLEGLSSVSKRDGSLIVVNRTGEIVIADRTGRDRERHKVIYGARLLVKDGQEVKSGTVLAEWDPFATPILTEVAGIVKFGDILLRNPYEDNPQVRRRRVSEDIRELEVGGDERALLRDGPRQDVGVRTAAQPRVDHVRGINAGGDGELNDSAR